MLSFPWLSLAFPLISSSFYTFSDNVPQNFNHNPFISSLYTLSLDGIYYRGFNCHLLEFDVQIYR